MIRRYRVGQVVYEVHEDKVVSRFPDGTELEGTISIGEEDQARASALGYKVDWGNGIRTPTRATRKMHEQHDLVHHIVADALGWPYCPVLFLSAHGQEKMPVGLYQTVERLAFLVQAAMNRGPALLEDFRVDAEERAA